MNAIQHAIKEAKFRIPMELLQEAFVARTFDPMIGVQGRRQLPVSLDHLIRQHVIEERVIPACDLVGGTEVNIPLNSLVPQNVDQYTTIYTVPKRLTQGRVISRVMSITIGQGSVMGTSNMGLQGSSPMLDAAAGVLQSALPIPMVSTAYIQMIGENTFLINDNMALPNNVWLRCILEGDSQFSHLTPTMWMCFARLCEYAIKAFIYNRLVIEVGMAHLVGGQELGRFKDILDGYNDANENFLTMLDEEWRKAVILSDPGQSQRHLSMLVGGIQP